MPGNGSDTPAHSSSGQPLMPDHGAPTMQAPALLGVAPPCFRWDASDLPHEFKQFRRWCQLLLTQAPYATRPKSEVVNLILLWMGPRAVEIYDNWTHLSQDQREDPAAVRSAFADYFEPKANFRLARLQRQGAAGQIGLQL